MIIFDDYDWYINGEINQFKFSEFGRKLNNEGNHEQLISIHESFKDVKFNEYCNGNYAKALYKSINRNEIDFNKEYEIVKKIVENVEQLPGEREHFNSYVISIMGYIRRMKRENNINFKHVFELLSLLNPDVLSMKEFENTNKEGKDYIFISSKELYYTMMVKAAVKLEKFDLAISIGKSALKNMPSWNYNNDLWIKSRILYSKCRIGDNFSVDIKKFIEMSLNNNQWYFYSKISDLLYRNNKIADSVSYASRAVVTGGVRDKNAMVNLFYELALLLIKKNKLIAEELITLTYNIRKENEWYISDGLKYHIKLLNVKENSMINFKKLQRKLISFTNMNEGYVDKLYKEKRYGFIKSEGKSYYFKITKQIEKRIEKGQKVYFDIFYDEKRKNNFANNLLFLGGD